MINKKHVNKETILETTLQLIDENNGIKNVTLRDIAKKLGCAHTNLYNYFSTLDEIFWQSLGQALLKMMNFTKPVPNNEADKKQCLFTLISNLIDFSLQHPGWHRLIWQEPIGGTPPTEVLEILNMPGISFNNMIISASNGKISDEKVASIGNILHGYIHGELCKLINNRYLLDEKQDPKAKILANSKRLYTLLIEQD